MAANGWSCKVSREVWLPVLGYEAVYEASNFGKIRRVGRGELAPVIGRGGYSYVSLSLRGETKNYKVSVLVLSAFCGRKPFEEAVCAHNDGNSGNDYLTNLRWAYPADNSRDMVRHNTRCRGVDVYGAVLTENQVRDIRSRIAGGERNRPIAESYGVSISTIHLIRHHRIWKHVEKESA